MKFKLVENKNSGLKNESTIDTLNEAVTPQYRTILFNVLSAVTDNTELKKLLSNPDNIEIHHMDSEYEPYKTRTGTERIRAKNNSPGNIAIVTKSVHKKLKGVKSTPEDIIAEGGIPLAGNIPNVIYKAIEDEVLD